MDNEPVSRFWGCFFASGLAALLWTQKMKKTRKWISMIVILDLLYVPILFLILMLARSIILASGVEFEHLSNSEIELRYAEIIPPLSIPILVFWTIVRCYILIRKMYEWTTRYNLENFGKVSQGAKSVEQL